MAHLLMLVVLTYHFGPVYCRHANKCGVLEVCIKKECERCVWRMTYYAIVNMTQIKDTVRDPFTHLK